MSVSVGTLLAGTQPAILAPSGSLIGRTSAGEGGPEPINVGAGLVLSGGTLAVVGQGPLPQTGSAVASDLVCISREGVSQAVSYSQFLDGQTIDAAQPARPASDTDAFWVAQGSNIMLRQSLSSIWSWIVEKAPSYKIPIVELTTDTTLDGTVHNARLLVCSQPLTLTSEFTNMGSGFTCEVLNLSTGVVNLGGGFITAGGSTSIQYGQSVLIRGVSYSGGSVVFAAGTTQQSSGTQTAPPSVVTSLVASSQTSSSVTLSWAAPESGGPVSAYIAQYRVTGTTNWTVGSTSILSTSFTANGLAASTSYDFQVSATGAGGLGSGVIVTASTSASSGGGSSGTGTGSASGGSGSGSSGSGSSGSSGSMGTGSGSGSSSGGSGSVSSITWNVVPSGSYTAGNGSIGVNAHVSPPTAPVQFGFSTSASRSADKLDCCDSGEH